ncbi:MAG: hypothetical protein AAF583_15940 [Pseudomonadota bacterium]
MRSPWNNDYDRNFGGESGEKLLDAGLNDFLKEVVALIERWQRHYNAIRPNRSQNCFRLAGRLSSG